MYTPLADCGLTKKEVPKTCRRIWDFRGRAPVRSPCLATRLPYGTEINLALLEKIDRERKKLEILALVM